MTGELLTDIGMACHHRMTLVRLRDGVFPSGQPVPADHPSQGQARVAHIVLGEVVLEPGMMVNIEPVTACCGLVFAPGTLEIVAWGTVWPHEVCIGRSNHPRSFVSRVHRHAQDTRLLLDASDEDMDASIALLEKTFVERGRDWIRNDDGNSWTYEASFNGVFPGDRLFPRGRDIGLERLTVQVPYPGKVHIHACGVRDGCSRHLVRTETFSLNDMEAVEDRISSHEIAATSIPLMELAWCLVTGDCSAISAYEPNDHVLGSTGTAVRCAS